MFLYFVKIFINTFHYAVFCSFRFKCSLIIPALSKESSGILLLPLSVRPSVLPKEKFVTGTPSTFKDLRNDTLGSHWVCLVDAQ